MTTSFCQSCGMPMQEHLFGTELTGERSSEYCSYCYDNGAFLQPDITLEDMIQICIPFLQKKGMDHQEAETLLQTTLPTLNRWRKETKSIEPRFETKEAFSFVGVGARTANIHEMTGKGEIPALWEKYFTEQIMEHIPAKLRMGETIALYSNYESDQFGEYTFSIGAAVENTTLIPEGMMEISIPSAKYAVFTTEVGPVKDIVMQAWMGIWKWFETANVERTFTGDFEVYDEKCTNPDQAQVDIYIAIK